MGKKWIILWIFIVIIAIVGTMIYFLPDNDKSSNLDNLSCMSDEDCVPKTCCHADSCVARGFEEKCSSILCTQECKAGTLDCGQARCSCIENKCAVNLIK